MRAELWSILAFGPSLLILITGCLMWIRDEVGRAR